MLHLTFKFNIQIIAISELKNGHSLIFIFLLNEFQIKFCKVCENHDYEYVCIVNTF